MKGVFPVFPEESIWRQPGFKFAMEEVKVGGTIKPGTRCPNFRGGKKQ